MDKDILLQILKCDPISFTLNEIEDIMDEELNKDPDEMDSELIDMCARILEKAYFRPEDKSAQSGAEIKPFKELLCAAIV